MTPAATTTYAVVYARVSTSEQADKGASLPTQIKSCRAYAARLGLSVVAEFQEDISGATPIESRPAGGQAYHMLKGDQADTLIVHAMDRLVRPPDEGDEWDIPVLIRGLAKLNKEIHTVERGRIGTSFSDLLIAVLDAKSAGDERRRTTERTRRGRLHKASDQRRWVGTGSAFYGYRRTGKGRDARLEIDPVEIEHAKRIWRDYDAGGVSLRRMLQDLTRDGVPPPVTSRSGRATRGWHKSSLLYILKNPVYVGKPRSMGYIITAPELAIIDEATFERVQKRIQRNKELSTRNQKYSYMLSGFLTCVCGHRMTGAAFVLRGKLYRYYRCSHSRNNPHRNPCRETQFDAGLAERLVWDWLVRIVTDGELLTARVEARIRAQAQARHQNDARRLELNQKIADGSEQLDVLAGDLKQLRGATGRAALIAQINRLSDDVEHWRQELDALDVAEYEDPDDLRQDVLARAARLTAAMRGDLGELQPPTRRGILDAAGVAATLTRAGNRRGLHVASEAFGVEDDLPLD